MEAKTDRETRAKRSKNVQQEPCRTPLCLLFSYRITLIPVLTVPAGPDVQQDLQLAKGIS